jgi:hypothetical protein
MLQMRPVAAVSCVGLWCIGPDKPGIRHICIGRSWNRKHIALPRHMLHRSYTEQRPFGSYKAGWCKGRAVANAQCCRCGPWRLCRTWGFGVLALIRHIGIGRTRNRKHMALPRHMHTGLTRNSGHLAHTRPVGVRAVQSPMPMVQMRPVATVPYMGLWCIGPDKAHWHWPYTEQPAHGPSTAHAHGPYTGHQPPFAVAV